MAKMNIYIPDELKMRMDMLMAVNWSAIAQHAFELEINSTVKKGSDMEAVIERLRASKTKWEEEVKGTWLEDGRKWASDTADYEQLSEIGELDLDTIDDPQDRHGLMLLRAFAQVLCGDVTASDIEDARMFLSGDDLRLTRQHIRWFLEGAQAVWHEVKDKL